MTNEMIKQLCGDIIIYIAMGSRDLPHSANANVSAIQDIASHIYEKPVDALEWTEPLFKMVDGLYEMSKYYESDGENNFATARSFASRLYDELREMRP